MDKTTQKSEFFRSIPVHFSNCHGSGKHPVPSFSGAYPFTLTDSSVTFVLELTIKPVREWQEQ